MQSEHPIETLESRIAPAAVFSYRDADGDLVKLTTSKGTDAQLADIVTFALIDFTHIEVRKINFAKSDQTKTIFAGTSLTMKVVPGDEGGDGRANIGAIDATGVDLGAVTLLGDLGQIDAGNPNLATPALKSLTVGSIGRLGLVTQGGTGDLTSTIVGGLGKLTVRGDVVGASISVQGSGAAIGVAKIGGSVREGVIACEGSIANLSIGGDVTGLTGVSHGRIVAGSIGTVAIKGSLLGGDFDDSGLILSNGKIGSVSIGGDLVGGSDTMAFHESGLIRATADIGKVTVAGSIRSANTTSDFHSTGIRAGGQLGSVVVGGSLVGGSMSNPVVITGFGDSTPTAGSNVAIGSVKIGGSAIAARIAGGVDNANTPYFPGVGNGDAQIGSVVIKGDLILSSIHTGVKAGVVTGDADDALFTNGDTPGTIASIAKIVIGGLLQETTNPSFTNGLSAEHFGSVQIGLAKLKLNALGGAKDRIELGDFTRSIPLWEV